MSETKNNSNHSTTQTKRKNKKIIRGLLSDEVLNETQVKIVDKFRVVKPYAFHFKASTKERWIGMNIIDMYAENFQGKDRQDYIDAVETGRITVNDKTVTADYIIQNNDQLCHTIHRHEPPVRSDEIDIVFQDENIIVIDKPSSIAVHPCGRWRHLTIQYLLAHEKKINPVYVCHRLDRLTSGILILTKQPSFSASFGSMIRARSVQKYYLALVNGNFNFEKTNNDNDNSTSKNESTFKTLPIATEILINNENENNQTPWIVSSAKMIIRKAYAGICSIDQENGVSARTSFKLLKYDSKSNQSLMLCVPSTGRCHQIRTHLKHLGFPIADDPLYQLGDDIEPTIPVLSDGRGGKNASKTQKQIEENKNISMTAFNEKKVDHCSDCINPFVDPIEKELSMFLHAFQYTFERPENGWPKNIDGLFQGKEKSFQTKLPFWSKPFYSLIDDELNDDDNEKNLILIKLNNAIEEFKSFVAPQLEPIEETPDLPRKRKAEKIKLLQTLKK